MSFFNIKNPFPIKKQMLQHVNEDGLTLYEKKAHIQRRFSLLV